ncbi:MAG: twin-arginine translocase TatA/TatE family subunit [Verrucomicrobia bacterium]|nr:MAG: twin-arginine translocase TatA/TatE family subunit [Verrucomicrobiota bacterium]
MNTIGYFGMPGGSEIILILFIILLLFGAKKLPDLSRSLGKSLGEFKKGKEGLEREIRTIKDDVQNQMASPDPDTSAEESKEEPKITHQ